MALKLDWTGRKELERLARVRWQCYGAKEGDLDAFTRRSDQGRFVDGDVCIASDNGMDVGTATSLSLNMQVRGKRIACQGVAWVGTSKSHRRRAAGEKGVASQVMDALLQKARDRKQPVTALMPFRASFYEHFGYGIAERQQIWTIPIAVLNGGADTQWRFGSSSDKSAMLACRNRQSSVGQCDVETSPAAMDEWFNSLTSDSQLFVDDRDGKIVAYCWIKTIVENEKTIAQLAQPAWESLEGLRSIFSLLASFRDQYTAARVVLPVDLPINWWLRERQIPHRLVEHAAPAVKSITRMQIRVLDHVAFMDGQRLLRSANRKVTVAVRECEGTVSNFTLDLTGDAIRATPVTPTSMDADVEMSDVVWASIASGDLRASTANALGLTDICTPDAVAALDVLGDGPAPFCYEYF